jgi:hypothetical protein
LAQKIPDQREYGDSPELGPWLDVEVTVVGTNRYQEVVQEAFEAG